MAGNRGGRRHRRAYQVGAATTPLPALEVAVTGRGAPLARPQDVRVHAEAHRAARVAPFEAGLTKDRIQAFGFGLALDARRSWDDHSSNPWMQGETAHIRGGDAEVHQDGCGHVDV